MTEETLDIAMINSFNVIVLDYDWEDIIDGKTPYFAHNMARRIPSKRELENILKYFIETEDYERCASLQRYMKEDLKV